MQTKCIFFQTTTTHPLLIKNNNNLPQFFHFCLELIFFMYKMPVYYKLLYKINFNKLILKYFINFN